MSVVKLYSDARKELERIANQRKHFLNNSKALRDDMLDTPHNGNTSSNRTSVDRYAQTSPGNASTRYAGSTPHSGPSPLFTPMSAKQNQHSSHRSHQNINQNQQAHTSSSGFNMSPASNRRESERIERTIPSDRIERTIPSFSPISQPVFQNTQNTFQNTQNTQNTFQNTFQSTVTSPGLGTASSVIGAFRQLQAKSRKVELERCEAIRERDELQRQVSEHLRAQELWRSQSESQTVESFQQMKAASDQLIVARRGIELSLLSLQEVQSCTQRSNSTDRAVLLSLETERVDIRAIQHTVKCNIKVLEGELAAATSRHSTLNTSSPSKQKHQTDRLQASISSTQNQLDSVQRAADLTRMRCSALERYMELVLKINGDLTKRIADTAGARAQMREMAEKLTPPRYAWPKELNHDCITSIVSEVTKERTIHDNTARMAAAKATLKKKGKRPSSAPPRRRVSTGTSTGVRASTGVRHGYDSKYGMDGRVTNRVGNDDDSDVKIDLERNWGLGGQGPGVRSLGSGSRGASGAFRGAVQFDLDTAYRALSVDPSRRKARQLRNSLDNNNNNNNNNVNYGDRYDRGHDYRVGSSSQSSTTESSTTEGRGIQKSNPIRLVKCRGTSASSSSHFKIDSQSGIKSSQSGIKGPRSPNRNLRSSQATYTGAGGGGGDGYGNKPPVTFMKLDGTDSLYNQRVSAAAVIAMGVSKGENRGFIPGGNTEAKEFNVVARGSKIARATTHFNAAVAARLKAYKKDMIGEDLIDMMM